MAAKTRTILGKKRDVLATLRRARALVREKWCKSYYAVTGAGKQLNNRSTVARRGREGRTGDVEECCLYGALLLADGPGLRAATRAVEELLDERGWRSIEDFNDSAETTRRDVLRVCDRAIAKVEKDR